MGRFGSNLMVAYFLYRNGLLAKSLADYGFLWSKSFKRILSGQIIATSHDLGPPKGSGEKEMGPLISGKSRLAKYYSLAKILWNILVQSNEKLKNDPHWRRFVKQIPWKCDDILYPDSSYLLGGTLHRFWCNYNNTNISSRYVQSKSARIGSFYFSLGEISRFGTLWNVQNRKKSSRR